MSATVPELVVQLPSTGIPLDAVKRAVFIAALEASGWVKIEAAKFLHVSPRVINYNVRKYEIARPADNPHARRFGWRRA
jgi:transcriptional regulator with GAF, ATPase, and Fis domain